MDALFEAHAAAFRFNRQNGLGTQEARIDKPMSTLTKPSKDLDKRERIVKRIARELRDGFYVNLGIGLPTLIANHVPPGMDIDSAI